MINDNRKRKKNGGGQIHHKHFLEYMSEKSTTHKNMNGPKILKSAVSIGEDKQEQCSRVRCDHNRNTLSLK